MAYMARILISKPPLLLDTQLYKKPSCAQLSRSLFFAAYLLFGTVSYSSQQIRSIISLRQSSANFITSQRLRRETSLALNTYQPSASWIPLPATRYPLFQSKFPSLFCHLQFQLLLRQDISRQRLPVFLYVANSCGFDSIFKSLYPKSAVVWDKISAGLDFETRQPKGLSRQRLKRSQNQIEIFTASNRTALLYLAVQPVLKMPIQATTGRYKRTYHPAANYKNAGLKSDARSKPSGSPYAYQQLKKFNDLHALKNPDWRNRPSDNSSSVVDDSEHDIPEVVGAGKQRIRMDASPPTPRSAVQGRREAELQQTINLSQEGVAAGNNLTYSQSDIFAISSRMERKILKTLEEEEPVQYQVLKQLSLSSSREYPLNLFEVAPLDSIPSYSPKTVVDIRPLRGNLAQRKQGVSGNSQDEQLTAALRAADTTPLKVRAHVYQAHVPCTISNELRARNSFSETHELYASQRNKAHVHTDERQLSKSDHLENCTRPTAKIEIERDEAFQRFLNKLGKNSKGRQGKKTQEQDSMDNGHDDGLKKSLRESPVETSSLRHRAHGADVQKKTTSELFNNSHARGTTNHCHKEGSNNSMHSGVFLNEPAKFKNFNPKAREFLSFAPRREPSSEEGDMEPFQPCLDPLIQKDGRTNTASLAELASLMDISSVPPPPPYGIMPFVAAAGATDHLALNNLMARRLIPVSADHFGGSLQAPAMSLQPLSLVNPAMLQHQPVLQPLSSNILALPAANLMSTAFPLATSSVNPFVNMPSSQMPLMGGAPRPPQPQSQPHPVPKPRRPDPRDQQAYEAWIEWRKANQPGYAYECRMRQQRRAQRSSEDKAPSRVAVGQTN